MDFVDSKCICEYTSKEHSESVYLSNSSRTGFFGGWLAGLGAIWWQEGRGIYLGDSGAGCIGYSIEGYFGNC